MKQIVFINQDSGYLMIDIINAYTEAGYPCALLTGRLVERNKSLINSVKLNKIIRYNRRNYLLRFYSWSIALVQILYLVWFRYPASHLFIVSNPPLAPLVPLFCKNTYTLLIFDVYIEKLKEISLMGQYSPLASLWIKAHKKVLERASHVFTLTEGMCSTLMKYSGKNPVEVINVWTDNDYLKPIAHNLNPFVLDHEMTDKFVVLYSGNIGASSGVETILEVANVITQKDILFVIIGDGLRKGALLKRANDLKLKNCVFLPWQDTNVFPYSLASANLAIITLAGSASKRSIPSKLYNLMSVGAPILCIANSNSDLVKVVRDYEVGECFESANIIGIANFIKYLAISPVQCEIFSKNSLRTSALFTPGNAYKFVKEY